MATLTELHSLAGDGNMLAKVRAATAVVAYDVMQETTGTNLAARQQWAYNALTNPGQEGTKMWQYVLAANNTFTKDQILEATDAAILTKVAEAVDKQYGA